MISITRKKPIKYHIWQIMHHPDGDETHFKIRKGISREKAVRFIEHRNRYSGRYSYRLGVDKKDGYQTDDMIRKHNLRPIPD